MRQAHDIPTYKEYRQPALHITIITESQRRINKNGDIQIKRANTCLGKEWQRLGDNIRCKLLYFTGAVPPVPPPEGFTIYGAWLCLDIRQKIGNEPYTYREYEELRERLNNNLFQWVSRL